MTTLANILFAVAAVVTFAAVWVGLDNWQTWTRGQWDNRTMGPRN